MKKSLGKRILSVLFCACILAGSDGTFVRAASATQGSVSGNEAVAQESESPEVLSVNEYTYKPYEDASYELKYSLNARDGGISITGYTGTAEGMLVIPDSINGASVVEIAHCAFYGCSGFTGDLALPDSLFSIGDNAFDGCSGFTGKLVLPDSLSSIGDWVFYNCSGFTGDLVLPDSLSSIGYSAFYGCSGFTGELVPSNSLSSIGDWAFDGCSGFTGDLVLPNSLSSIGYSAFSGCSGFTGDLVLPDSLSFIGDWAFSGCSGFTGELVLPNSLSSIGNSAFYNCSGFNGELALPNSLSSIGDRTFYGCSGFTGEPVLPDSLSSIGNWAFYGCSGFTGALVLPDSLSSIGSSAFRDCSGFTDELMLPDSLSSIGKWSFSGCSGFTGELMLPDSVCSIGEAAFIRCNGLNGNIIMSDSVTSIGTDALFLGDDTPIIIHAPKGSYGEAYALENGYTFENSNSSVTLGDVPQDSWKYEPALYVYKRGVMTGKGFDGDGNVIFAPDEPLTREQFAQVLYSAEGKENVTYTTRFHDVADGQWYTNAVLWAADKGIVSGYEDGRYGAGDPITREQLAAMLYKYAQYKGYDISAREAFDRFTDADQVSGWAVNQLQWAVANGVMSGKGETLDPLGSATRAECAAMLRTFLVKFE